jgi:hypothetical protein
MGECSSDIDYAGIIAMNIVTMCGQVFAEYCVFLDHPCDGIMTGQLL